MTTTSAVPLSFFRAGAEMGVCYHVKELCSKQYSDGFV